MFLQLSFSNLNRCYHSYGKRSLQLLLINLSAAVLLFVSNYVLVHTAGEENYGKYVLIITWVNILSLFVTFGFEDLFLTIIPKHSFLQHAVYRFAIRTCSLSFAVVVIVILLLQFFKTEPFVSSFQYFIPILLLVACINLYTSQQRAAGRVVQVQALDKIIRPLGFVLLLMLSLLFFSSLQLHHVLLAQVLLLIGINIPNFLLLRRTFNTEEEHYTFDRTLKPNISFLLISVLTMMNARIDILFLSEYVNDASIGHYNIAAKLAEVAGYPLMVSNMWLPVYISEQYGKERNDRMITPLLLKASGIVFTLLIGTFAGLYFFSDTILSLFGSNFQFSKEPALILACTYFFSCFSAPINAALMVSGRQRQALIALIISCALSVVSAYSIIPVYGMNGAALGMCCGSAGLLISVCYFFFLHPKKQP